jgi:hypothetical protein
VGRCGGGDPWKAAVVKTISTKSGEGWGWFGHRRGREADGRKRGTSALVWGDGVQRERKGVRGTTTLAKGDRWRREKGRGGPVLGHRV